MARGSLEGDGCGNTEVDPDRRCYSWRKARGLSQKTLSVLTWKFNAYFKTHWEKTGWSLTSYTLQSYQGTSRPEFFAM